MAYVTVAQLKAALADAGGAGARTAASLPDERLRANLDEATAEVVGRLTRSFKLPDPGADPTTSPDTIPPLMRTIIVGVAGYLATLEFYGSQPLEPNDPTALRYARAKELLSAVAGGALLVDGLTPASEDAAPGGEPAIYGGVSVGLADVFNDASYYGRANTAPYSGGIAWE